MGIVITVLALVATQRIVELIWARRHVQQLLARGGYEVGARHYPLFFALHIAWFVAIYAEANFTGARLSALWTLWAGLAIAAQGLRYWAIVSLGEHWTTRVIVVPGMTLVTRGPFRWMRHPNYLAVTIEIACVPLIVDAWRTALVASVLNALLLAWRIRVETRALANA